MVYIIVGFRTQAKRACRHWQKSISKLTRGIGEFVFWQCYAWNMTKSSLDIFDRLPNEWLLCWVYYVKKFFFYKVEKRQNNFTHVLSIYGRTRRCILPYATTKRSKVISISTISCTRANANLQNDTMYTVAAFQRIYIYEVIKLTGIARSAVINVLNDMPFPFFVCYLFSLAH